MLGEWLTRWTIRLALACYVAYLAGWLTIRREDWPRISRWVWTLGCVLFVAHVACAFHFFHHWSHQVAWQTTAEETERLLGVAFGNGLYGSYLFLAAWVLDVVWLWTAPLAGGSPQSAAPSVAISVPLAGRSRGQTPWWRVLVHIFLLFIAFNGAIVFESGPTRWAGIVAVVLLAILAGRAAYNVLTARRTATATMDEPQLLKVPKNRRTKEPKQLVR